MPDDEKPKHASFTGKRHTSQTLERMSVAQKERAENEKLNV